MYKDRLINLRKFLREQNVESVLISKLANIRYFSGFSGDDARLFITMEREYLLTDARYLEQAGAETDFEIMEEPISSVDKILDLLEESRILSIGIEGNSLTFNDYSQILNGLKNCASVDEDITFQMHTLELDSLRIIKEPAEIQKIQVACDIADQAFEQLLDFIRPGRTEIQLAAQLEFLMRQLGSEGASFPTIVASGVRGALPHGVATTKVVERGELITFDFGAIYEGYHSDITRTIALGEIAPWQREIYDLTLQAQCTAVNADLYQMSGVEVNSMAWQIIQEAGYTSKHGLGHGVGLEIHELPRLSSKSSNILENNMVFTIEPGIYLDGRGGVRIEDSVEIVDGKVQILTHTPKELIQLWR